jgi:hypothetical protein
MPDAEFRGRLIAAILAVRDAGTGQRPGIYGAEVCQICGGIGTFSGLVGAMSCHASGTRDFFCRRCPTQPSAPDGTRLDLNASRAWAVAELERQPHRFCAVCTTRIERRPENLQDDAWLCAACRTALGDDRRQALRDLVRRRYIDLVCRTDDELRAFAVQVRTIGLNLEEIVGPEEERSRLSAERSARARAVLDWLTAVEENRQPPAKESDDG